MLKKDWHSPASAQKDGYNDYAFALPANASYLARKRPLADQQMGDAVKIGEVMFNERRKTCR